MMKDIKPGREYFVINIDEPYAAEIFEVLKRGQRAKGQWPEGDITFKQWVRKTFGPSRKAAIKEEMRQRIQGRYGG
jgi:hypothetical protein